MHLTSLHLVHFRCFDSLHLSLPSGITLFHGDNAQGKTSILEAACVLLRLQSPRAGTVGECVKFTRPGCSIGGRLESADPVELKLHLRKTTKKLEVDGENQKSASAYLRHSSLVVWMANDDLSLVRGGGEGRRRYLDFMSSQLYPEFRAAAKAYDKALKTRNFLLKKDAVPHWKEIDAFTWILQESGEVISRCRRQLVADLSPRASETQNLIAGKEEWLGLEYHSGTKEGQDLVTQLHARRDEELRRRQTLAGPHRDDLLLTVHGMPAGKFASEGQQRTVALALKVGQARLFTELKGVAPVMLIDDVFGELDPGRRNALMAVWPETSQKLITTTHLDWLDASFGNVSRFLVKGATAG